MTQEKILILSEFRTMISNAWTFERLTEKEKNDVMYLLSENHSQTCEALKGNKKHCWNILQAIYSSYLIALNYKPIGWREETTE